MRPARASNSKPGRRRARANTPRACCSTLVSSEARNDSRRVRTRRGPRQPVCAQAPASCHRVARACASVLVADSPSSPSCRMRACFGNMDSCRATSRSSTTATLGDDVSAAVARRSVVVLDSRDVPSSAALALLRLRQLGVREFGVLARRAPSKKAHVMKAAEGRAAYGGRPPAGDPRVAQIDRRGRTVAGARPSCGSRASPARGDRRIRTARRCSGVPVTPRSGSAGSCSARGRAADASALFTSAHDRFQRAARRRRCARGHGVSRPRTDRPRTTERCRAAPAAPPIPRHRLSAIQRLCCSRRWHSRARCCGRSGTPTHESILEAVTPAGDVEQCARYWCLAARLRIAADAVADAWRFVERARPAASDLSPAIESVVRECEAAIQGRLGDIDALRIHVTNGLAAARAAHLPLQAIKLRLALRRRARQGRAARTARARLRVISNISAAVPFRRC